MHEVITFESPWEALVVLAPTKLQALEIEV